MNILRVTSSDDGFSQIKIAGIEDVHLDATTKKVSELGFFSKIGIFFSELRGKKFVQLNTIDGPYLVKIADLAKKFKVAPEAVIEAADSGTLSEDITQALGAHAQKTGGSLKNARAAEEVCAKLDALSLATKGADGELQSQLATKGADGKLQKEISQAELESIKKVVRVAFQTLALKPEGPKGGKEVEELIAATPNYRILAKSSENSFQITGLFGKIIGGGGFGAAIRTVDLLTGTTTESVLKVAKVDTEEMSLIDAIDQMKRAEKTIAHEADLLDKIHGEKQAVGEKQVDGGTQVDGEKQVVGIQKKLRVVQDLLRQKPQEEQEVGQKQERQIGHLSPLYAGDLLQLITGEKRYNMTTKHKIQFANQLLEGLSHIHKLNITHGDIKPENIFFNGTNNKDAAVFLADFGGAIDHSEGIVVPPISTAGYTPRQDKDAAKDAFEKKEGEKFLEIQKKRDVFALCSTICILFTGRFPYSGVPGRGHWKIISDLETKLMGYPLHLSENTANLLTRGLDSNYTKRPNPAAILASLKEDLDKLP